MKENLGYIIFNIILIITLIILGIYGYNIHKSNLKEKQEKENIKINTNDKNYLKNITIALFNDSYKYLTFNSDNTIAISIQGKITTAAKTMYLNGNLYTTNKINENSKTEIIKNAYNIFGGEINYNDFIINFSDEYCGVDAYSSKSGKLNENSTSASGKCSLPFMIFEIDNIEYDKENNSYYVKVYYMFVDQLKYDAKYTCKSNEKAYSKIVVGYADNEKNTDKIYNSTVVGCCKENECETAAIYKEKDKILNIAKDNNLYYTLTFKKKSNNNFKLESIIKAV